MKLLSYTISVVYIMAIVVSAACSVGANPGHDKGEVFSPAQIVIIGTLHGYHKSNPKYSIDILRRIIVALDPTAILFEMPPTIGGQPTVKNDRIPKQFAGNENTAANLAAEALGVPLIPYDREGRNEFYKKTRFFDRAKHAYERLRGWTEQQDKKDPESVEVLTTRVLYESAKESQVYLIRSAGPEIINSSAFDMIILNKHCIQLKIWPKMLAALGERELAGEFLFFRDEWETRNQIMADNIIGIAQKHVGKRLVVLCGAEHRYILRDLLDKATGVTLKEFYEIPGWAAKEMKSRPTSESKDQTQTMKEQEKGEQTAPANADKPHR